MAEHNDDSVNLALLAHDLRTPLGAMRLTAELIETGPLTGAQKDQLAVLVRAIDALNQMTSELLVDLAPEAQDQEASGTIAAIVADCSDLFRAAAQSKGLQLDVVQDEAAAAVQTQRCVQLRRVLSALLDNAIKYTSAGGVALEVASCPDPAADTVSPDTSSGTGQIRSWVSIAVTDTGPGIDPEEQEELFRPFVRGKKARDSAPGTGLGLWGTVQTIQQMGGFLGYFTPDNGGSRFEIKIPVEGGSGEKGAGADLDKKPPKPEGGAEGPGTLPDHVLIVDDNETNCRLLAALLESFGVSADVANSGEQAIGFVQKIAYEAVLLDLHMPGLSGLETAEEIRRMPSGKDMPLIAVTAALESVGDNRLRQAGFQEVLTKPLSPTALHGALEQAQLTKSGHRA